MTVLIGNMPAARMGDMTAHGGSIVLGEMTVMIGDSGSGGGGGGGGGGTGASGTQPRNVAEPGPGMAVDFATAFALAAATIAAFVDAAAHGIATIIASDLSDPLTKWRAEKKEAIEQALADQRQMLEAKKAELETWDDAAKEKFKTAFGVDDDESRDVVLARIDRMLEVNKGMTVDNFKPADPSKPDRFAYVYPNDAEHTVYLDQAFDGAPSTGEDSKAGALSHEMSHFDDIGGTEDAFEGHNNDEAVYGKDASRDLATSNPDLALKHADSFEYYVEDAP